MNSSEINIIVNGKKIKAQAGEKLVEIIQRHEIPLSAPCYHKLLTETGHCGLCLVGARRKVTDRFSVVFACTATAKDGMEIDTECEEAVSKRNELFKLHLLQHPLDCSKCDKVGYCFLHKFASQTKFAGFTRTVKGQLQNVKYKEFGQHILFDTQKCIGCQRCIRFCRDVLGEELLGFIRNEDGYMDVDLYPGKRLNNNYSLNLVDLCPAGAFVNKNCVYQPVEWDLVSTPSISTESSVGINTYVLHKDNKVFRIKPRENKYVNGSWISDSARNEHKYFENKKRLTKIMQNGQQVHLETAILQIVKTFLTNELAVVCSGNVSLEDQFVLRKLLDSIVHNLFFLRKKRTSDGFLVSDDATPNVNGAILNKIITEEKIIDDLEELNQMVQSGQCRKILSINEEIFSHGVSYALPDNVEIFYIGTENNKTSKRAAVTIPVTTVFENTGTFINKDWRLQKFYKAVNPPNGSIFPMWYIFSLLLNVYLGAAEKELLWLDDVWKDMSHDLDSLADVDFFHVAFDGILLKNYQK
ncbi:MAG: (2Fe-2S)-binding protein [Puniceicoccales bacterium]|jgi:NADH-quinone oxidoreductase subunit G|nr:(2Fe-2S)-binding protein [Puniceicoccales bacterium]